MRWLLLWLALTLSPVTAQGPVAISRRYHTTTVSPPPQLTRHLCHIQQLAVTRRYLETVAARLSLDVRGLLAVRRHSNEQLRESSVQGNCDCESANLLTTPTPTPASLPEAGGSVTPNGSWQLKPAEAASDSTADEAAASSQSGSFFSSTMFVLAVFFMAVPVACVIGFVLFCKRRRRQQHTHA
ncbi:hypothetical protein PF005_g3227 [Phytophthora fragariae]|uniref:RxLR effector protein n=1 Tax=Phytophthora fragariae TaxID=53985 RepID=A0A6A4ACD2_9STRA|nr:hypothetical protein PF003_g8501 [Phytophthora fragariae]KAE8946930.1 hypothetical protein PF009_g3447 [Phytophthora fragariae]KAE9133508.1 hypothetical protein PF010_g2773 [Phytophthora fragariae]KAE9133739.1 hypothetical protein PF007_g3200 [Phytophthora fragariae]KAE9153237.1 hypothetical protein PF006_g2612 [Phytophthora fragariae]